MLTIADRRQERKPSLQAMCSDGIQFSSHLSAAIGNTSQAVALSERAEGASACRSMQGISRAAVVERHTEM